MHMLTYCKQTTPAKPLLLHNRRMLHAHALPTHVARTGAPAAQPHPRRGPR
jgi:hypothetical protein